MMVIVLTAAITFSMVVIFFVGKFLISTWEETRIVAIVSNRTIGGVYQQNALIRTFAWLGWRLSSGFAKLLFISIFVCILIPLLFASIYSVFWFYETECIRGISSNLETVYFSFTTFTTLGYGDLSPVGYCRAISSVEAISGYVTMGILVAAWFSKFVEGKN